MGAILRKVLADQRDMLLFRPFKPDLAEHRWAYLAWGVFITWLVGLGRYWDDASAAWWQNWGLGSLAYVFFFTLILWAFIWPMRPRSWSYANVLLFVMMTSPPALIYAIPVEEFMTPENARTANYIFLLIVASWRVALLVIFLRRAAALSWPAILVVTLLPVAVILTILGLMGLERPAARVVRVMGGVRNAPPPPPSSGPYKLTSIIGMISAFAIPFLLVGYSWLAERARNRERAS